MQPPLVPPISDVEAEIKRLREQVTVLEARVRQRISGAAGGGYIPMIPGLIPAELYQWLEDRQTDLQEARVLKLTSKMTEAELLKEITCSSHGPLEQKKNRVIPTSVGCWVAVWVRRPTLGQYRLARLGGWRDLAGPGWRARRWNR